MPDPGIKMREGDAVVPVEDMEWDAFSKHLVYRHHVDPRALNGDVPGFTAEQEDRLIALYAVYHGTIHRLNFAMYSHVHTREV